MRKGSGAVFMSGLRHSGMQKIARKGRMREAGARVDVVDGMGSQRGALTLSPGASHSGRGLPLLRFYTNSYFDIQINTGTL